MKLLDQNEKLIWRSKNIHIAEKGIHRNTEIGKHN